VSNATISLLKGGHFDFLEPEKSVFTIEDVARGLSNISRFSGHVDRPYTVSQHSVLVSKAVPPEHALAGLLHDAVESFLGDVAKPLKNLLPDYMALEEKCERVILKRFGVKFPLHPCVKEADNKLFVTERRDLQPGVAVDSKFAGITPLNNKIIAWDSHMSYIYFIRRFEELTK
jgi:uncharacterized protein